MAALSKERARSQKVFKLLAFTLKSGTKGYKGGKVALDIATGKVVPATSVTAQLLIGVFAETIDATSADKSVTVDMEREIQADWWTNGTAGEAIAATDVGKMAYQMDDQTVSILAGVSGGAGRCPAGRIWAVDSTKGILVEKMDVEKYLAMLPPTGAYAANDYAPTAIENDAIYDVPTTGAASTITLPAAAPDGTRVYFQADGTKNAHTVQYRDATGPTALTTALTAAKRHLTVAVKRDGKWTANAYVSP